MTNTSSLVGYYACLTDGFKVVGIAGPYASETEASKVARLTVETETLDAGVSAIVRYSSDGALYYNR